MSMIFISYRHGDPWTRIAERLDLKLRIMAPALNFRIFFDKTIDAGLLWREEVQNALAQTTHLIVLLCDEYWLSPECQRELQHALARFRASGHKTPRLLFVLGERMRPDLLIFDNGMSNGSVVGAVGDISFLGPYDDSRRLVRLERNDSEKLSDQLSELADALAHQLTAAGGSDIRS